MGQYHEVVKEGRTERKAEVAMSKNGFWVVVGVSMLSSSLITLVLFMAIWGGQTVFAKDNPTPQKEVRAQNFVLVDKDGNTRGVLGMSFFNRSGDEAQQSFSPDKSPGLSLFDSEGNTRVHLSVPETKADASVIEAEVFNLIDSTGKVRAILGENQYGDTSLMFTGPQGEAKLALISLKAGGAGLIISNNNQTGEILIGVEDDGKSTLNFNRDKAQAALMVSEEGESYLVFTDKG